MKPNNLVYLKCSSEAQFIRTWVEFLTPFHRLTARERDVAARIIVQYFRLKEGVQDPEVLRDVLWSKKSRKDMMDSLKMSQPHFQMVLAKLKNSGFLVDGTVNSRYIPNIGDDPRFCLQIVYDWSSKDNPIRHAEEQNR